MLKKVLAASVTSMVALAPCELIAQGSGTNLGGTWRCAPDPSSCQAGGQTFIVTQSGNNLEVKNDKGNAGQAQLTSNISLSAGAPWSMWESFFPTAPFSGRTGPSGKNNKTWNRAALIKLAAIVRSRRWR
jgi:hypothetical protein